MWKSFRSIFVGFFESKKASRLLVSIDLRLHFEYKEHTFFHMPNKLVVPKKSQHVLRQFLLGVNGVFQVSSTKLLCFGYEVMEALDTGHTETYSPAYGSTRSWPTRSQDESVPGIATKIGWALKMSGTRLVVGQFLKFIVRLIGWFGLQFYIRVFSQGIQFQLPSSELTYPLPAGTFESVIFLFPVWWDMDESFPGG